MAGNLFNFPRTIAFDVGVVQAGAKITFTATGTTTPQNTYTDIALTTPSTNPVVADAEGLFAPIYLDPTLPDYRVKYTDSSDVLIYQDDDVPASEVGQSLTLTAAAPFIDLIEDDAAANNTSWRIQVNGEQLTIQVANDALSAFTDILTIDRTANTVDLFTLKEPVTLEGLLTTNASTTASAGVNIPDGDAPTSPVQGDIWATATDAFMRNNGVNVSLLGVAKKVKDTSQSRTSTTLIDDPDLLGFPLETGKRYAVHCWLHYDQNVGNFKFAFEFSNAPVTGSDTMSYWSTDESKVQDNDMLTSMTSAVSITTMTDSEDVGLTIEGSFTANASTGGTLDFQWAQENATNSTTLFLNSWMTVTKLD